MQVRSVQFSPEGRLILSGGDDRTAQVYDVNSNKQVFSADNLRGSAISAKFHPSGTCFGVGCSDGSVRVSFNLYKTFIQINHCLKNPQQIYDLRSSKLLQLYDTHTKQVNKIDFHPSGKSLILFE